MTNSFRPQAQPVDTFVRPSTVAPTTGFDQLVNALKTVNPAINQYFDSRIREEIEEEKIEGIQIAEEEAKQGFKKLTSTIRKKDGDEVARQLVGGSIFAQSAYEKHKARLLGQSIESEITNLYQTKTFPTINEDGEEIQTPLHHFSGDSSEYQEFIKEAAGLGLGGLQGIKDKNIIEHFSPYQQKAIQSITKHHLKQHNEFKFNRTKKLAVPTLWSAFKIYKDGDPQQALTNIDEWIDDNVILGLTADKQTKFFNSLIDTGKSVATRAIELTEGSFAAKENALDDAINMIGEISHGPGGKDKLKNHPDFETKMSDLRIKLSKESDRLIKRKKEKEEAAENFTIEEFVRKYATEPDALERLVEILPERKDYILERIELDESDRTQRFKELEIDIASGEINREDGLKALAQLRTDIGSTFTDEDDENYKRVLSAISTYKSIDNKFNSRLTKTIQEGHRRMGSIDPLIGAYDDVNVGKDISELNVQLRRDMIDTIELSEEKLSPREKEQAYRDLVDQYFKDIEALKEGYKIENLDLDDSDNENNKGKDKGKDDEGGFSNFMELLKKGLLTTTPGGGSPVAAGTLEEAGIKPNVDPGGLAELIRGGESSGRYNVYNTGTTDSTGQMDITSMTIADVEKMQQEGKVFAVGAYQFTPGVLTEARIYSNIDKDAIMTPIVQDRLVLGMLLDGRKRPNFADYVKGESDNINAAHLDLAKEFAAIQGPDGKGYYDNDKAGNSANIPAEKVRKALIEARKTISGK